MPSPKATIILLNKPFNTLSQFTDKEGRATLSDYLSPNDRGQCYPAGRLDYDSEGLMVLTDNGALQHRISAPKHKLAKTYWAQVEGLPTNDALTKLAQGVELKDGLTQPATVRQIDEPALWARTPPIRERKNKPTSWLELTISEGKNRQVRRMTAAVGLPTLRLIRAKIGDWALGDLQPGDFLITEVDAPPSSPQKPNTPRHRKGRTSQSPLPRNKRASNKARSKYKPKTPR